MSIVWKLISSIGIVLKYHKKRLLLIFISMIFFFVLLFPYDDLSAFITKKISTATNNLVFLHFDKVGFHFTPPSFKLTNVSMKTPSFSLPQVETLFISPSFLKLLTFRLRLHCLIPNLWGGEFRVTGEAKKKKKGSFHLSFLQTTFKNLPLKEIIDLFASALHNTHFDMSGQMGGRVELHMEDIEFKKQPKGELEILVNKFQPPVSINTALGPFSLPKISFSKLYTHVRMDEGKVIVDQGVFKSEPLSGKFKGEIDLTWRGMGDIQFGKYKFKLDMQVQKSLESQLSLFFDFISKFKVSTQKGSRYSIKLTAPNLKSLPTITSTNQIK